MEKATEINIRDVTTQVGSERQMTNLVELLCRYIQMTKFKSHSLRDTTRSEVASGSGGGGALRNREGLLGGGAAWGSGGGKDTHVEGIHLGWV
jgi:hypothetical protein